MVGRERRRAQEHHAARVGEDPKTQELVGHLALDQVGERQLPGRNRHRVRDPRGEVEDRETLLPAGGFAGLRRPLRVRARHGTCLRAGAVPLPDCATILRPGGVLRKGLDHWVLAFFGTVGAFRGADGRREGEIPARPV